MTEVAAVVAFEELAPDTFDAAPPRRGHARRWPGRNPALIAATAGMADLVITDIR